MKKNVFISILLIICLAVTVSACNKGAEEPGPDDLLTPSVPLDEDPSTHVAEAENPALVVTKEDQKYIPEDAEVLAVSEENLRLVSSSSFETVQEFYQDLVVELGATGEEFSPETGADGIEVWGFEGTTAEGELYINLQSNGEHVSISIAR